MNRNTVRKLLAGALACLFVLLPLASCSSSKTAMQYKSKTLPESDYAYIMAFIKGYYEYYYSQMASYYGTTISLDSLYDYAGDDGVTFEKQLVQTVDESCMMLLVVEQLCDEFGLKVQDEETIAQINQALSDLKDDYGGEDALEIQLAKLGFSMSSLERYEYYNAYLTLLKDYRYGENGVARIPDEDVNKAFAQSYVKAEGYSFAYYGSDGSGSNVQRILDFASDVTDDEARSAFPRLFVKVEYLSYEHKEDAELALKFLNGGRDPVELYESSASHVSPVCILKTEAETGVYKDVEVNATWTLVNEEDGSYVVRKSEVSEEDFDGMLQTVKEALVSERAYAYFEKEYVTVQHILYDTADEATAKGVYEDILAGRTTFEEHTSETKDGGLEYTFTKGKMVTEFENDAFALEVGGYSLTQTTYGWHIIHRLPLNPEGYDEDDVLAGMSREKLKEEAEKLYAEMKKNESGATFSEPGENALYTYSKPTVLELSSLNATMSEALKNAKEGELVYLDLNGSGAFILRRLPTEQADVDSVKDSILTPLQSEAFHTYLSGFYDQVTVNRDVLDQFNIRTAESFYY